MQLKEYKEMGELLGMIFKLGFTVCLSIGFFVYIALEIEKRINTNNTSIIFAVFAGFGFSAYSIYKNIKKYIQDDNKRKQHSDRN